VLLFASTFTTFVVVVPTAFAAPQISSGVTAGAAVRSPGDSPSPAFSLGGRVDVLLGRNRHPSMGLGPYAEFLSTGFRSVEAGAGAAWLVPTWASVLVASGGFFGRSSSRGFESGAGCSLFWGARSYNFHSSYAPSAGLFVQARFGLGESRQADVLAGAQVDLEYFALPFLLLYEAVAH
jgi:hypothetical protein